MRTLRIIKRPRGKREHKLSVLNKHTRYHCRKNAESLQLLQNVLVSREMS